MEMVAARTFCMRGEPGRSISPTYSGGNRQPASLPELNTEAHREERSAHPLQRGSMLAEKPSNDPISHPRALLSPSASA
jgi:hypothetical protein